MARFGRRAVITRRQWLSGAAAMAVAHGASRREAGAGTFEVAHSEAEWRRILGSVRARSRMAS